MGCIETAHPDLDALTLTGSTATGAYLRTALSGRNVRPQTETGGKNASVVLASDSRYGLSAGRSRPGCGLANEFIDRAEAGQVAVNLPTSGWDVHHPVVSAIGDPRCRNKAVGGSGLDRPEGRPVSGTRAHPQPRHPVGIVGCPRARRRRQLAEAGIPVVVFEKEAAVAVH